MSAVRGTQTHLVGEKLPWMLKPKALAVSWKRSTFVPFLATSLWYQCSHPVTIQLYTVRYRAECVVMGEDIQSWPFSLVAFSRRMGALLLSRARYGLVSSALERRSIGRAALRR